MPEIAVNVPLDSAEICHILAEELQSRLRGLSPLQGGKEYAAFSADFQIKIKLRRVGETITDERETLAWTKVESAGFSLDLNTGERKMDETLIEHHSTFESKEPNEERVARDMPLLVESSDGRGGRIRKKVRVKG